MTHLTPSPQHEVRAERLRALGWALPQLIVLGLALATMPRDRPVPEVAPADLPPAQQPLPEDPDASHGEPTPTRSAVVPTDGPVPPERRDVDGLLYRLLFQQRHVVTEKRRYSDLISLLKASPGPAVSIINLWSPSCKPCREEFKGFRELLPTWEKRVRFISVQLGEDDPGELLAELPTSTFDLHDIGAGNGTVRETLATLGLAEKKATIPITMVLDCSHRLRWIRTEAITDMTAFRDIIDEQIREMPALCPPSSASFTAQADVGSAPGSSGPICGDGRCSAGESWEKCCKDCGCPDGQHCATRNVCVPGSSGLM